MACGQNLVFRGRHLCVSFGICIVDFPAFCLKGFSMNKFAKFTLGMLGYAALLAIVLPIVAIGGDHCGGGGQLDCTGSISNCGSKNCTGFGCYCTICTGDFNCFCTDKKSPCS